MTGGEFIKRIESYRADGSIPEELTGDDIARALTSAVYGNSVIRCAKGIQDGCLRETADLLKVLHADKSEQEIVGYIFFWLNLWELNRKKPVCEVPAMFCIDGEWVVRNYAFRGAEEVEHMKACAEKIVIWEKRDSMPLEIREDEVACGFTEYCGGLRFPDSLKACITVTYQGVTGSVVAALNELKNGNFPISWRTVRKKAMPLSKMDKVHVHIKASSSNGSPEELPADAPPPPGSKRMSWIWTMLALSIIAGTILCNVLKRADKASASEPTPTAAPASPEPTAKKKKPKKRKTPKNPATACLLLHSPKIIIHRDIQRDTEF